jgi:hypothetical protein
MLSFTVADLAARYAVARLRAEMGAPDYLDEICARKAKHDASEESDTWSTLALGLNVGMLCDDEACERYRQIYGREWEPVPPVAPTKGLARGTARYERSLAITSHR